MTTGNKGDRSNDECYKCGGRGHFAIICPTQEQRPTLLCEENATGEETTTEHELPCYQEEEAEENLEGSTFSICVIRRMLAGSELKMPQKMIGYELIFFILEWNVMASPST
jgi:hypothetical protein